MWKIRSGADRGRVEYHSVGRRILVEYQSASLSAQSLFDPVARNPPFHKQAIRRSQGDVRRGQRPIEISPVLVDDSPQFADIEVRIARKERIKCPGDEPYALLKGKTPLC